MRQDRTRLTRRIQYTSSPLLGDIFMLRAKSAVAVAALAGAALLVSATAESASAAPAPSDPIASGLAGPLQIDANEHGVYVAQDFAGILTKVRPNGTTKTLVSDP